MESMTLSFPDPDKRICVLTDASDRFYDGLMTQIHEEQLDLPINSKTTSLLRFWQASSKALNSDGLYQKRKVWQLSTRPK
jgi:hypothetical protein